MQTDWRQSMKRSLMRTIAFVAGVFSLASPTSAAGQTGAVSDCTADMLEIRVLPPIQAKSVLEIRTIVVELQNRAILSCTLPSAPHIELLEQGGADELIANDFEDDASTAEEFQKKQYILAPGEVVHALIVWPSRGSWNSFGCFNRDRMALAFNYNQPPLLEVQHLWARLCDRAYVSRFRVGHYAGESIPATWLKRFQAQPSDFAVPDVIGPHDAEHSPIKVDAVSDGEMLNDGFYSQLFVSLPHIEFDCPYVLLRKREPDGKTKVYLNHCDVLTPEERSQQHFQDQRWSTRLDVGNLGMSAEQPGTVEYEVVAGIGKGVGGVVADKPEKEKKVYAAAQTQVLMMDPEPPALPVIDSPQPDCQAAQLKAADLSPMAGGPWHEAHIYNVTNISDQACRVGGLPRLELFYPPDKSHTTNPKPCPNCSDPLFLPRPSGWIDLVPGDSAHFLVGSTRFDLASSTWRMKCDVPGMSLVMTAENLGYQTTENQNPAVSLPLPFGTGTCAQFTVTAWRAGKYDDDPVNIQFDQRDEKRRKAVEDNVLPKDCEKKDFSKTGRPVIFPASSGLQFGMSVPHERFVKGKPIGLYLWQVNPTDKPLSYMSCPPLFEMEVFDFYGHRVLDHVEQKREQNQPPGIEFPYICSATIMATVPPHTCSASETTADLSQQYSLPPGEYLITRRDGRRAAEGTGTGDSRGLEAPVTPPSEGYPIRPGIVIFVDQQ